MGIALEESMKMGKRPSVDLTSYMTSYTLFALSAYLDKPVMLLR